MEKIIDIELGTIKIEECLFDGLIEDDVDELTINLPSTIRQLKELTIKHLRNLKKCTINFEGTINDWDAIQKGSVMITRAKAIYGGDHETFYDWAYFDAGKVEIVCLNGTIKNNPNKNKTNPMTRKAVKN